MPKPVKIAIIVIGLAVGLGAMGWYFLGRSAGELPSGQLLVNVETGQVKSVSRKSLRLLPAPDDNGEPVWYPAVRADGKVRVIERYQDYLVEQYGERTDLRIDLDTFEVIPHS